MKYLFTMMSVSQILIAGATTNKKDAARFLISTEAEMSSDKDGSPRMLQSEQCSDKPKKECNGICTWDGQPYAGECKDKQCSDETNKNVCNGEKINGTQCFYDDDDTPSKCRAKKCSDVNFNDDVCFGKRDKHFCCLHMHISGEQCFDDGIQSECRAKKCSDETKVSKCAKNLANGTQCFYDHDDTLSKCRAKKCSDVNESVDCEKEWQSQPKAPRCTWAGGICKDKKCSDETNVSKCNGICTWDGQPMAEECKDKKCSDVNEYVDCDEELWENGPRCTWADDECKDKPCSNRDDDQCDGICTWADDECKDIEQCSEVIFLWPCTEELLAGGPECFWDDGECRDKSD